MNEDLILQLDTGQHEEDLIINAGQTGDDIVIELDPVSGSEDDDIVLSLDNNQYDINLTLGNGNDLDIRADTALIYARDYNRLVNKPKINGVELIGNKPLSDLCPNGFIIDAGDSSMWGDE